MNDDSDSDLTPAERYAASRRRARARSGKFGQFAARFEFDLDPFQQQACLSLESGRGVLVAAPTGSGKTVVGEFAIHLALDQGGRAFYTTPIKALSNQKYRDLCEIYGSDTVGLLTGDTVINGDAPVVVMTTEVLRNMLYEESPAVDRLTHVVMDEVHYLADRQRGAVWEEVILHLPERIMLVALSATVSNAEEFGAWLSQVRGMTDVIVEESRPIPLHQHVLVGRQVVDLFVVDDAEDQAVEDSDARSAPGRVNPVLIDRAREDAREARSGRSDRRGARPNRGRAGSGGGRDQRPRRRYGSMPRPIVIERLDREGLLPAIVFVFSRRGCEDAVSACLAAGVTLTSKSEQRQISDFVDEKCRRLPDVDLGVLGYFEWRDALTRGVAAHHAGMLPLFKETVEELFTAGFIKVVYATETLALGINMPARSVVIEKLVKWNGSNHAEITAGEYTQLTGRAGRRGIDVEGHAVTIWHDGFDPQSVAGLASTRTYPLKSSFHPSYNMAGNLIERLGTSDARELLETSFAQFQADAGVVGIANQIRRHEQALNGYQESMQCHLGDFTEYAALRDELSTLERAESKNAAASRRAKIAKELAALRVGDIVMVSSGRRMGAALVVEAAYPQDDDPRPRLLSLDRRVRQINAAETPNGVTVVGRMKVPKNFEARSAHQRRDLARQLADRSHSLDSSRQRRAKDTVDPNPRISELRAQLRAHPCHGCSDREVHARWAQRYHKLKRETDQLRQRANTRTNSIARQFDRVCAMLTDLGYLSSAGGELTVTDDGRVLANLYADQDLLTAECIRARVWQGLTPEELAGAAAALVYESRTPDDGEDEVRLPGSPALRAALAEQFEIADDLAEREARHRVSFVRQPNPGFSLAAWHWARGDALHTVLGEGDLAPGDFVRWCRQLIDLLSQIADCADDSKIRECAQMALAGIRRGVVAYSSLEDE